MFTHCLVRLAERLAPFEAASTSLTAHPVSPRSKSNVVLLVLRRSSATPHRVKTGSGVRSGLLTHRMHHIRENKLRTRRLVLSVLRPVPIHHLTLLEDSTSRRMDPRNPAIAIVLDLS